MRRLQFKFPNQIRIFGWDFGSSARAMNQAGGKDSLMTYESVPTAQADLGKVSRSTTERKSMSTKTSIKRIALVAVAALGFGVVSAIPSNAGVVTTAWIDKSSTIDTVATTQGTNSTAGLAGAGDSITAMTSPVGSAIVFIVKSAAGDAFATTDRHYLYINNQQISVTAGTAAQTNSVTLTAPAAGTYTVLIKTYVTAGAISAATAIIDNTLTLTTSASALPQYGIATSTANSTSGTLAGVFVPSVGVTKASISGRVGVPVAFTPSFKLATNPIAGAGVAGNSANASTGVATLRYTVTGPTGSAVTTYTSSSATTADNGVQYVSGSGTRAYTAGGGAVTTDATSTFGSASYFTPTAAGTYTITVWHDGGTVSKAQEAGEASAQTSIVIQADALPTITFTQYGAASEVMDAGATDALGKLVKVSLRNGTTPVTLAANETLTLTGSGAYFTKKSTFASNGTVTMGSGAGSTTQTLTSANFNGSGDAYVNVLGDTGATSASAITVSASISGGTAAGATGSFSFTLVDDTGTAKVYTPGNVSGLVYQATGIGSGKYYNPYQLLGVYETSSTSWAVKRGTATAAAVAFPAAALATAYYAQVVDSQGLITGCKTCSYSLVTTTSTTTTPTSTTASSFSVTVPATSSLLPTGTTAATIDLLSAAAATAANTISITANDAAAKYLLVDPAATASTYTIRAGAATTNTFVGTVDDQFGNPFLGAAVTGAITGRNSTTVLPTYVSDANGQFKVTLADTYTGTILLTDAIALTSTGTAGATITINYATYNPVSTITVTVPDTATAAASGIAGTVTTDIYAQDGAENGAVAVSAVLKDANGGTLPAGLPVTFSLSGNTNAAILSTYANVVTDSNGKATVYVYGWKNGNTVVTATAGGKTGTGTVYFKQADCTAGSNCAEARTVAAKATGNTVTATVTDRYGNPIKGVNLVATRVGTGTFGGASSATAATDKNGEVQFILSSGSADVTVAFATTTFGQSYATKGYVDAGVTALTAYTAGTASVAEAGVGASFDAAGVNSATVAGVTDAGSSDAIDAANEATDAANAATDAANAAAEAADAATAAAQDAQAAVAALASQVADLIAGIKAQITALTNLVIKIQKKVKA